MNTLCTKGISCHCYIQDKRWIWWVYVLSYWHNTPFILVSSFIPRDCMVSQWHKVPFLQSTTKISCVLLIVSCHVGMLGPLAESPCPNLITPTYRTQYEHCWLGVISRVSSVGFIYHSNWACRLCPLDVADKCLYREFLYIEQMYAHNNNQPVVLLPILIAIEKHPCCSINILILDQLHALHSRNFE